MRIIILCFVIIAIIIGCSHDNGKKPPEAISGILDLSDWDFEKDGPIRLKGMVEFYWDTLLAPDDFAPGTFDSVRRYVPVSAKWSDLSLAEPEKRHFYKGTYRFTLRIKNDKQTLGINTVSFVSASRFWINREVLLEKGAIGTEWKSNFPQSYEDNGFFIVDRQENQVIIQIACFDFDFITMPEIMIATSRQILNSYINSIINTNVPASILLFLAGYCLILFFKRRSEIKNFFLSCMCCSSALICFTLYYGSIFQHYLFALPCMFVPFICLLIISTIFFLKANFPYETKYPVVVVYTAISFIPIILWCIESFKIAPTGGYWYLTFAIWLGISPIVILVINLLAIVRKREGSVSFLIGMLFLYLIALYGSYCYNYSNLSIPGYTQIYTIGFLCFAFYQVIMLAIRHAQSQNQLVQKYEQSVHTEKLAVLGTVVAGVAHEINNPNNSMMLDAQLNEKAWKSIMPILEEHRRENGDFDIGSFSYSDFREEVFGIYDRMKRNSDRIKRITEDLRSFAKKDIVFTEDIDVNLIIRSALSIIEHITRRCTKNLVLNLNETLPHVYGNTLYLEQVVINLIKNSCQSLPSSEKGIFITTSCDTKKSAIAITIRDEGMGMDEDTKKSVLVPFFTTKGAEGTGLGLTICNTIVKNHHGTMEIQSEKGAGTTITVNLPIQNPG